MSVLEDLAAWFQAHCDGDWEHGEGITIESLDNPGWRLSIELADTELEHVAFTERKENLEHESKWLRCWRDGTRFEAACGPTRLQDAIRVFLDWARQPARSA